MMDDRELDQRLGYIEEKVTLIESVIQQYWSDFMKEGEVDAKEEEDAGKSSRIKEKE